MHGARVRFIKDVDFNSTEKNLIILLNSINWNYVANRRNTQREGAKNLRNFEKGGYLNIRSFMGIAVA